ncbi:hypothetical protein CA3LBN_001584 [Candidozyma haemuli]|uniref:TLDc domain-containing protein n=1 Tax=Candidozyma haemuli TaxID=45357 RepID=A0ABX8I265_9ASCO|nr:hypothetical protein CA3LBN_001584 [[Candida] haemuloni]
MGQAASNEEDSASRKSLVLESFTKEQINKYFQLRCVHLLTREELSSLASRLNVTSANDPETAISYSDVAYVLQLSNKKDQDISDVHHGFVKAVKLLTNTLSVLARLPFLQDFTDKEQLTLRGLIISSTVLSGRIRRMLGHKYNYLKLLFIAFAAASGLDQRPNSEKSDGDPEKAISLNGDDQFVVEAVRLPNGREDDEHDDFETARRIKWDTFANIKNYDDIKVDELSINGEDLVKILTLLLVVSSVPKKSHEEMQAELHKSLEEKWSEFEVASHALVRFFDFTIDRQNLKSSSISYKQFHTGCERGLARFIIDALAKLVERSIFSSIQSEGRVSQEQELHEASTSPNSSPKKPKRKQKFEQTRLVNEASLSLITLALRSAGKNISVGTSNIVNLYNGSQSGFSIRSLESKIFKWHAPTILLVSGKRLKSKTINTNRRYQEFDQEYPRYFLANENPLRSWQGESDRITYAVFLNSPWKSSNKKNFGDEETVIVSLSPRFDYFKSRLDPVLQGQSVYFSNLGMGLGFGNDQPVNKNTIRKYLPGNVSLTIEANLEFAVFRHIRSSGPNSANYFEKSAQQELVDDDYEDRFMITDLEVWGIGSNKELEEQRKLWEWEEKQAKARQSVNVRDMGEERAFLEMAGLIGNYGQ